MPTENRPLRLGSINGGSTPIYANVAFLGMAPVRVRLLLDYSRDAPTGGFPLPSFLTGVSIDRFPVVIAAGTTIAVGRYEADALITAGAAVEA